MRHPYSNLKPAELASRIQWWRGQIIRDFLPNAKSAVLSGSEQGLEEVLLRFDQALQDEHSKTGGGAGPDYHYLVAQSQGLTVADIALLPFMQRVAREYSEVLAKAPALRAWYEGPAGKDPAYRKTIQSSYWWWW